MSREPAADRLDRRDVARAVDLPEAEEAAQLALEVAGRLAEALEAGGLPVDGVDLDERVDELLAHAPAVLDAVELGRDLGRDDEALDLLHHVERRADHRRRRRRRASTFGTRARPSSARSTRASRSTSWALGGSGPRGGRRSTNSASPRRDEVGDVRVPVADRLRSPARRRRGRARRGRPAAARARAAAGARSARPPRGCGRRRRRRSRECSQGAKPSARPPTDSVRPPAAPD